MQRIPRHFLGVICAALALVFAYLAVFSLIYTSIFDPEIYLQEHVLRVKDHLGLNLLFFLLGVCVLLALSRLAMKLPLPLVTGLALGATLLGGVLCALLVTIHPRADPAHIYNAATDLIQGNWEPVILKHGYFQRYSFQLGLLQYMEAMQRIFGPECYLQIRLVNAAALTASYAALLSLLWQSFRHRGVQACAALLLTLFAPGILYVTFIYGTLPGLALAFWGAEQCCRWIRQGGWVHGVLGIALLALSTVFKLNCLLIAVAVALVSFLFALRHRRLMLGIFAVCVAVCPYLFSKTPILLMQARTGAVYDEATPQAAWLVMGMQEGPRAAGWYNDYGWQLTTSVNYEKDRIAEKLARDLTERLDVFWHDPAYAISFFHSKLTSQWAETTYESIWVNQPAPSQSPIPILEDGFLNGAFLPRYMDIYGSILYACFSIGSLLWARKLFSRKACEHELPFGLMVLVVAVFGGLLYHLLFEAKSQYLFPYVVMMVPMGAYGMMALGQKAKLI